MIDEFRNLPPEVRLTAYIAAICVLLSCIARTAEALL